MGEEFAWNDRYAGDDAWTEWFEICSVAGCRPEFAARLGEQVSSALYAQLARAGFPYIYAALRTGITGSDTTIDDNTRRFLKAVAAGGSRIYGGFGISSGSQARALADQVEAIVAGSVFVRLITENKNNPDALYKAVRAKAEELSGR